MQKVFLLEDLCDETHVFAYVYSVSVSSRDACALLTPMLQGIETKKSYPGDVFCRSVDSKNAAGFVQALQGHDPRWTTRSRRTEILPFTAARGQTAALSAVQLSAVSLLASRQ